MKTNYSRLLMALVSSVSMATTVGLSAQPGISAAPNDYCWTLVDDNPTQVIIVARQKSPQERDTYKIEYDTGGYENYVLPRSLSYCSPYKNELDRNKRQYLSELEHD